jgi:hypothetical protein
MGQVEKLRALLAEARERLQDVEVALADAQFLLRADAALAEPVVECARCEETEHAMHLRIRAGYDKTIADSWRAKVAEVERERDEARAEVRRTYIELSEAVSRNAEAYERGAEAMREAAYQAAYRNLIDGDDNVCADTCRAIRTLRIPEDK